MPRERGSPGLERRSEPSVDAAAVEAGPTTPDAGFRCDLNVAVRLCGAASLSLCNVVGTDVPASHSKERKYWLEHKQLASLLNLELQPHASIGITLNLVFVGFSGPSPLLR